MGTVLGTKEKMCLVYFWGRSSEVYMSWTTLTVFYPVSLSIYEHLLPPTHTDGSSEIRSQEAASYRQGLGNYPALGGIIML